MCHAGDGSCRAEETSVDPGELGCWQVLPDYEREVEYARPVREQAVRWGKVFGVPSSWAISQACAESRNRPLASNKSGATGVLQVKLARARDLVRWLKTSSWRADREVLAVLSEMWHGARRDLYQMELNVMLATYDLRHLMGKFGRNHDVVAAAYNQGEGRIARCLAAGKPMPARAVEYVSRVARAKSKGCA
jgi:soluble lytic murein transglycosylase-like protein